MTNERASNERAFVAGAGLMGHGIAQVLAATGWSVALYEPDLGRATAGRARIAVNLERSVAKGRLDGATRDAVLGRIEPTADLGAAGEVDLVVEAVFEDLAVKSAPPRAATEGQRQRPVDPSDSWAT